MGSFSLMHWLVVGVVVLLLFGGRRIGDLGKGLGDGLRNFKKGLREDDDETKALPPSERSDDDRAPDAKTIS